MRLSASKGKMPKKEKGKAFPGVIVSRGSITTLDQNSHFNTGNFPNDFEEHWKKIVTKRLPPMVVPRAKFNGPSSTLFSPIKEIEENPEVELNLPNTYAAVSNYKLYKPSIQYEKDDEEVKEKKSDLPIVHAKEIYIKNWKVFDNVFVVMKQCFMEKLTTLNLWNVGIDESCLISLASVLKSIPSIKTVALEANPIPETEPYYLLIENNPSITNFSLRNNKITCMGASSIASILTPQCPIVNLNLSINEIGDEGAKSIATALRLNRTLLSLSVSCNQISDEGCLHIFSSLNEITLTHEEILDRRKMVAAQNELRRSEQENLLSSRSPSNTKNNRTNRERPVSNKSARKNTTNNDKSNDSETQKSKSSKKSDKTPNNSNEAKEEKSKRSKKSTAGVGFKGGDTPPGKESKKTHESYGEEEMVIEHAYFHPEVVLEDGKIKIPGCMSLVMLNLSRNYISEDALKTILNILDYQLNEVIKNSKIYRSTPGLLKLYLQRNKFNENHEQYLQILETMAKRFSVTDETAVI